MTRIFWRMKKETCPRCKGTRGWQTPAHYSYFEPTSVIGSYWNDCPLCGGKGKMAPDRVQEARLRMILTGSWL